MLDLLKDLIPGALVVLGLYVIYVAATKGVPAAWRMLKSWWTSAKKDLANVKVDVASLEQRVAALEEKVGIHAPAITVPPSAGTTAGA